ncbi:MAG: enoyl-CoA hydratase-related protein [Hyphomicrobiales bacterium]|nr:enoyl-CoA hydratase-related protein [Hyphomicrobiales bacterium]
MELSFEHLTIEIHEPKITVVIMNRPQALNAMNTQMMRELRDVFQEFYVAPSLANCIVLTGAGDRGFCSGADLKERDGMSDETWKSQHAIVEQMIRNIFNCPIPIIAAVNGVAMGGGFELALATDFIYAARTARFALPEVTRGIMPGAAGPQNLPRACGVRRAKEIVLTGKPFDAETAEHWGIVNKVCEPDNLLDDVLETARTIAENAPIGVRQAKKSLDKATELDRSSGYAFEIEAYNLTVPSEDRLEGVRAFNEKRKPVFKGR